MIKLKKNVHTFKKKYFVHVWLIANFQELYIMQMHFIQGKIDPSSFLIDLESTSSIIS